jgi:hypothetical protein
MSYEKAMKHSRNIRKCRKQAKMHFGFDSCSIPTKSIWADEMECICGYIRPKAFFIDGKCDVCRQPNNTNE